MNAHIPQSYEAAAELAEIAAVPQQIIRPRDSTPVIGVVQDALAGSYLATRPGNLFTRREFMNMMMKNKRFREVPKPVENGRYTGQQIVGTLFAPINLKMPNKMYDADSSDYNMVEIREGQFLKGIVDKGIFNSTGKGILHTTYNDYGPKAAVELLDGLQNMMETYLIMKGFSVGISDLIADEKTREEMEKAILARKKELDELLLSLHTGLFTNNSGKSNQDEFEARANAILTKALSDAGKIGVKSLSAENRLMTMVRSGSKGDENNVAQMIACLGQVAVEGKRIPYGFQDRTLPHFKMFDDGAEARGFVESSFVRGLSPTEFFFHAMAGREGLIDTAVKSVTGDTEIIIIEDGESKCVRIGEWIDTHLSKAKQENIERYKDANMELLNLTNEVYIPTCDENGKTSMGKMTAVTRHDPGDCLYEVKTLGGRSVKVAKSKSLIIWDNDQKIFIPKHSTLVKKGDFVPVCAEIHKKQIKDKKIDYILEEHNDVVKDKIVEINCISTEGHPKLYDVTVPSTLNFQIANGIICLDTADTGYTQRQLIKAMENLMTQHDGTVRDGMGKIVQFSYGEDGIASTKLESTALPLQKLSDKDIRGKFGLGELDLTPALIPGVERGDDADLLKEYTEQIFQDRKMLVEGVFASGRPIKLNTTLNLERIIQNIAIKFNLRKDKQTDLTPQMVLEGIQTIIERTQPFNHKDYYNKIWNAALRFHLAPHKMILQERFTKEAWQALVEGIVVKNWKAWAIPGELVGIVAAQSIGEPATQMCSLKTTKIVVNLGKNMFYKGEIGQFIDTLLEKHREKVVTIGENSVVLDLEEDIEILGVSNNEKTSWRRISQVSRHPANGGMVEVHTRSGRKTCATLTHSFLKRSTTGIVPVLGSDLKVGMRVPVARKIPEVNNPTYFVKKGETTFALDKELGWLCGIYLADGSCNGSTVVITKIAPIVEEILLRLCEKYEWELTTRHYQGEYGPSKENRIASKDLRDLLLELFGQGSYTKKINGLIFNAPTDFIKGLIGGYFDGDGNVSSERQMIRAGSRSQDLIRDINCLLGYCDMFGILGQEKTKNMPGKIMYTVSIPRKFAKLYKDTVGFELPEKAKELQKIIDYNEREDPHSHQEMVDKIPELGGIIAQTGRMLRMPGHSRTYGRWTKKESIGRRTLEEYIQNFKEMIKIYVDPIVEQQVSTNIKILESALDADVVWDEIVDLVYLDDPKEFVYDFTVPGNDSFMVDDNILVHNTLNTFHQAGVAAKSAMTRGVPRLKELLKVTKNPKATSITIALRPEFRNNKEIVRQVSQDLELTLLKDIVTKAAIYYDPDDEDTILPEDQDVIKFFKMLEMRKGSGSCGPQGEESEQNEEESTTYSKWILRFEFDREKMFNKNITMDDVYFVIQNAYGWFGERDDNIHTIYSDYNSQKLVMRIRPKQGGFMYGDDLAAIKKFLTVLLQNTVIRGVPGIRAVTWRKDKNLVELQNGEYKEVEQYLLDTDGSNFVSVLTHPCIDGTKIYSTNIHDIFEQLGIEATRAVLYSEINGLFDDADINYRHLGLLCDIMTHGGRPMSVDRYGINKMDNGPLAKACFEETEKILKNAAMFGEMDPVTGVSANIMMGQPIRAGTAYTQILLDEAALPRLLEGLPLTEEEEEEEGGAPDQSEIDQELYGEKMDPCSQVETQMNMILPNPDANLMEEEDIELVEL